MARPVVSCIITAYKHDPSIIIQSILDQTYEETQIIVVCSEIDIQLLQDKHPQCEFLNVPNREDWAHTKRAAGLAFAEGKYVCFVNDDDDYDVTFLEEMVTPLEKENADLAYCHWHDKTIGFEIATASLEIGGITSGSFVIRNEIAQQIGWPYRVYAGDWYFVRDALKKNIKVVYIPKVLMIHK